MISYKATIHAVDGERYYSIETPSAGEALEFLTRHDHEGAYVTVQKWEAAPRHHVEQTQEDAYTLLQGEVNG